jgi:hypothetical protein
MEASYLILLMPLFFWVISPLVAAFLIRRGYRAELLDLMAGTSPRLGEPPEQVPAGVRERLPAADYRLPAVIRHPQAAFRLVLYALVFWLVMSVIVPASAPMLGLRSSDTSFDWGHLLPVAIVGLVVQHRTALGYSGLGIYSFVLGASFSTIFGGLLAIVAMSIVQCFQGAVSIVGFLAWLFLGLPIVGALFVRAFHFMSFIGKLLLHVHIGLDMVPVGPGFKAFCFASMCMGMLNVPDRPSMLAEYAAHTPEVSWSLVWQTFEPWLRLALALGLPFVCVLLLSLAGLALLRWSFPSPRRQTVLYLRAFANEQMSVNFLRHFGRSWLERGAIRVISGPDVASHVMDASTLAAYLDDDLANAFIRNKDDLRARLAASRESRGWDLRFPIQEFRCYGAVWVDAFRALLATADRAIIDLRGLAHERAGIGFELVNVLQTDHEGKSVFIVDSKTSISAIESLWARASAQPPGLASHFAEHGLELIKVGSSRSAAHVVLRECEAAMRAARSTVLRTPAIN